MPAWDLLLTDANIATLSSAGSGYGSVANAAIAINDGQIAWLGAMSEIPEHTAKQSHSIGGHWLTPALIDCHTHLIFGGNRALEFEQRLQGVSYEEIARSGGGIRSTVAATRAESSEQLFGAAEKRVQALMNDGVATIEVKSGYGLNHDAEIKMLEIGRQLGERSAASITTTFLGAHAIPEEFSDDADGYIDYLIKDVLPEAHEKQLVDAVDAYCETIAFSAAQIARLFESANTLGLRVKLHADQLSDGGGAELAARFKALSADHLEYTPASGAAALAGSGSVAVMLPGAFLTLGETQQPPIAALRDHGVPIAVASDCNPGTSPLSSVRLAMQLATRLFKMTPEECLAGATREAARALNLLHDRGTVEVGKRADLAIWDIEHPRELSYWMGANPLQQLYIGGAAVKP